VIEVMMDEGDFLQPGTRILNVEPSNTKLEVVLYAPFADGKKVRIAMDVEIALSTVRPEEFGYLLGRVKSVSAFPITEQGMVRVLGAPEVARQFALGGQPYEITVELLTDPESPSGYRWSSSGPDVRVESGTACNGRIIVERQRPISLVIPFFKRSLGTY
jgi:HlyD family secretion protein